MHRGSLYRRRVCRDCKGAKDTTLSGCEKDGHPIVELSIWWIKYKLNGKWKCESSGTDKKGEAQKLLAKRLGAIAEGRPVAPDADRLTFEEAAQALITHYEIRKKKTIKDLKRRIAYLRSHFGGNCRMSSIVGADAEAFAGKRLKEKVHNGKHTVSAAEVNRELTVLKRIFSLAVKGGKLHHQPAIEMLPEDNVRQGFFEAHEYEAVLKHLPAPLRPVITFAYLTGWRIDSEVLPLEWRQVDRDAGEVRLFAGTTKNGEGRVVHFSPELRALFDAQWAEHERLQKEGRIVPQVFQRNGKAIKSIRIAWQNACRDAGCPGRIPHDLRRTAARNLIRNGVPEDVARKITGHKTRSVFTRYNVSSDGDLRAAALLMDGAMPGASKSSYTLATLAGQKGRRSKRVARIS